MDKEEKVHDNFKRIKEILDKVSKAVDFNPDLYSLRHKMKFTDESKQVYFDLWYKYNQMYTDFQLGTCILQFKQKKPACISHYNKFLLQINDFYLELEKMKFSPDLDELIKQLIKDNQYYFSQTRKKIICESCKVELRYDSSSMFLICDSCGIIQDSTGSLYEAPLKKNKSTIYNPYHHYKFWMDHILALEPEKEILLKDGRSIVDLIKFRIKKDNKILKLLTINDIRGYLNELKRTDLNKNTSLIFKKLTGIGPPNLPEFIKNKCEYLFNQVLKTHGLVVKGTRVNKNYYPYYIYKILEFLIPEVDTENRSILFFIYLQSQDTLRNNDKEWKLICYEIKEIIWRPTKRVNLTLL